MTASQQGAEVCDIRVHYISIMSYPRLLTFCNKWRLSRVLAFIVGAATLGPFSHKFSLIVSISDHSNFNLKLSVLLLDVRIPSSFPRLLRKVGFSFIISLPIFSFLTVCAFLSPGMREESGDGGVFNWFPIS